MQKNKSTLFLLLTISLVLAFACQKQSAPEVLPEDSWQVRDQARLEACSKVNFTKDLLLHDNAFHLFKCTGWDKSFPSLNRGIQNINPESWNHFFKPIDEVFLNDRQRRDRIFSHIRELDSKRGLDDLSRVITALNETNFYDALKAIFVCAENPMNPSCESRDGKELSKDQIKELIKLVELKPVVVKALAILVNELMESLGGDDEAFRDEIKKFFYGEDFINVRLNLVSSFAQKFKQGLSPLEKEFYKKVPIVRWKNSGDPYLYTWIQKPTFTNAVFRRLTNYAVTENPEVLKDIKLLKRGYHYPLYCKPYSSNGQIDIDLKTHVDEFLNFVYENEYEPFHDYIVQNVASLQLAISFCPNLKNYSGDIVYVENGTVNRGKHSLNFVELEKKLVDLTSEVPIFDLSKFVTFLASRNLGDIPPNPGFLLDIATEESTEWIVEMIKVIHASSDQYFEIAFKMLKNLKPEVFDSVGVLMNELLLKENDEKLSSLSRAWLFFEKEEQNFLFNYIDRHLQEDTDFRLLFNFYATMLEEYATVSPFFGESWVGSDESVNKSYSSLFDIVKNFSGPNVLRDFDKFFSRDHIITIMKVVTRGPVLRQVALNRLNANVVSDYISKLPSMPYQVDFTEGSTEYSRKAKICIDSLTEGKTLYFILNNFPRECEFFKEKEITLQTFSWLADAQQRYEREFNIPASFGGTLLDEKGFMSSDSLNNSIALLRLIDEKLSFRAEGGNSGGLKYVLDTGQRHLYDIAIAGQKGFKDDISRIFNLASAFYESAGDEHRYLRNTKLLETLVDDGPKLEDFLVWASDIFMDYSVSLDNGDLEAEEYIEDLNYSCNSYVNENLGGLPCPSKERVKRGLRSIVNDVTIKYKKNEATSISYFLEALIPGYGLSIPLDSKTPRLKRITMGESASMLYKLSDKSHPANRIKIEFLENDAYDENYDVDNWSGRKWRKSREGLVEIDDEEDHVKPEDELNFKSNEVEVTTMERIEITVRDVRFDMNYLGAHYKNAVAKGDDYNKTVESKLSMFKKCVGLRFCGKFFNKEQIRMAKNAVAAYPGLLDANKVSEFGFGDYMQALMGALARGSSKKARKSALLKIKIFGKKIEVPWVQTKKQLREHNGRVLTKISMLSGFSNLSRFVRDRMGRTPQEFEENMNSKKLKLLDEVFLSGMNPVDLEKTTIKLLKDIAGEDGSNSVLDEFIDWTAKNSYQEQREFEDFILDSSIVLSFLGVGAAKLDYKLNDYYYDRYRENHMGTLVEVGSQIAPSLAKFSKSWPIEFKFIDIVRTLRKPISFLSGELMKNKNLNENLTYRLLNEGYLLFKKAFAEETEFSSMGAVYLGNYLNQNSVSEKILGVTKSVVEYLSFLEEKNDAGKSGYAVLSENLSEIVKDKRFSLAAIKKYLLRTTKVRACDSVNEVDCKSNVHYDEPSRLIIFGSKKNGTKSSNIERFMDTLFKDNINDYTQMIDNLLPLIRIQLNN